MLFIFFKNTFFSEIKQDKRRLNVELLCCLIVELFLLDHFYSDNQQHNHRYSFNLFFAISKLYHRAGKGLSIRNRRVSKCRSRGDNSPW